MPMVMSKIQCQWIMWFMWPQWCSEIMFLSQSAQQLLDSWMFMLKTCPKIRNRSAATCFFRDQGTARYNPQNGGYLLLQHSLVGSFRRMPYLPSLKMQPMLAILALGPLECLRTSKASHLFIIKFIGVIRQLLYLFLPDCVVTPVELTLFSSIPLQIYPWSHPIA